MTPFARSAALAAIASFAACSAEDPQFNIEPKLDPGALHRDAAASLEKIAARLQQDASFLENSELTTRLGFDFSARTELENGRVLADLLIAPENLVEQTFSSLRYQINPLAACEVLQLEQIGDRSCAEALQNADFQVTAQRSGNDRIDLDLFAGSSRILELIISPTSLQISLELAQIPALLATLGLEAQVELQGSLQMRADIAAQDAIHFSAGPSRAIEINANGFALYLPAKTNAVTLSLDAAMTTLFSTVELGAVRGSFPLEMFCASCSAGQKLGFRLSEMKHRFDLQTATERLRVDSEGLGQNVVQLDLAGATILSVDLNETLSRALEIVAKIAPENTIDLSVTPGLAAQIELDFAPLAQFWPDVPAWSMGEVLSARLDRAPVPRVLLPLDDTAGPVLPGLPLEPSRIAEVAAGFLTLEAENNATTIRVERGQCLLRDPPETMLQPEVEHPFARLRSGPCR